MGLLGAHWTEAFEGFSGQGGFGDTYPLPADAGWFEIRTVAGSASVMADTGGRDELGSWSVYPPSPVRPGNSIRTFG